MSGWPAMSAGVRAYEKPGLPCRLVPARERGVGQLVLRVPSSAHSEGMNRSSFNALARAMMCLRTFARACSVAGRTRPTALMARCRSAWSSIGNRPARSSSGAGIALPWVTRLRSLSALRGFTRISFRVAAFPVAAPHLARLGAGVPGCDLAPLLVEVVRAVQDGALGVEDRDGLAAVVVVVFFAAEPHVTCGNSRLVHGAAAAKHGAPGAGVPVAHPSPTQSVLVGQPRTLHPVPAALKHQPGGGARQRHRGAVTRLLRR